MSPQDATRDPHWVVEDFKGKVLTGTRRGRRFCDVESSFQRIRILDTSFGKTLMLDDAFMCSEDGEEVYHEMLTHPALVMTPSIKKVLVIGGGDGGTVREVLRYPEVEQVTLCEIDEQVVRMCQEHFREMQVPWQDKRLELLFCDGMAFVSNDRNPTYDVILVDGADPEGPAAVLFTAEFYAACKRRLSPFGTLASQTEAPSVMREDFVRIQHTMRRAFGRVQPYFGPMPIYPGGTWSWTLATDRQVWSMCEGFNEERMRLIEKTSRYFNRDIMRGAFALPSDLRRALKEER